MELPIGTTTYMTLVSDSNIKHWSLSAAHCQMQHIAIVVIVEALGLFKYFLLKSCACSLAVKINVAHCPSIIIYL